MSDLKSKSTYKNCEIEVIFDEHERDYYAELYGIKHGILWDYETQGYQTSREAVKAAKRKIDTGYE